MRRVALAIAIAACSAPTPPPAMTPAEAAHASAQAPSCPPGTRRVLFQNRYWAKPGKADEVFAWRQHATDVQADQMGMPRGRVLRGPGGDEPDAIYQLEIAPADVPAMLAAQQAHVDVFGPIMDHMGELTRRFESSRYCEIRFLEEHQP